MRTLLVSILLLFSSFNSLAQQGNWKSGFFISDGDSLRYRYLLPADTDESRKYPLLLFLHGAGERGSDNEKQLVHGSKLFETGQMTFPHIAVFPQCPREDYWANIERDTNDNGERKFEFKMAAEPTVPLLLVMQMMDSLQGQTYVDQDRIYVGGLSMGGMGTFEILYRLPDTFAAAFPICGGGDTTKVDNYAAKVPMWVFHGAMDDVVRPHFSAEMVEAIRKAGGNVRFFLYPEANHNSWDPAFSEPELLPWLFSQRRSH